MFDLLQGQLNSFDPKDHGAVSIRAAEIGDVAQVVTSFSGVSAEGLGCWGNGTQSENADIVTLFRDETGWPSGKSYSVAYFVKRTFTLWKGFPSLYGVRFIHLNNPTDYFVHCLPPI